MGNCRDIRPVSRCHWLRGEAPLSKMAQRIYLLYSTRWARQCCLESLGQCMGTSRSESRPGFGGFSEGELKSVKVVSYFVLHFLLIPLLQQLC